MSQDHIHQNSGQNDPGNADPKSSGRQNDAPSDSGSDPRNDPGNDPGPDHGNDPWGRNKPQDLPPELEEMLRKFQDRIDGFWGMFGGKPRRGGGNGGGKLQPNVLPLLLLFIFAVLLYESTYLIRAGERGMVLRLGRHVETLSNGLHWRLPPPLERVERINAEQVVSLAHSATVLTRDENIVDVEVDVQYRKNESKVEDYLLKVSDPDNAIKQATEAAVREVIGGNVVDFILTEGRNEITANIKTVLQAILDSYQCGLLVNNVNIKLVKPPDAVKEAFDEATKAQADEKKFINVAEAYKNGVIPEARGQAARQRADAEAYRAKVVAQAQGEAQRFSQLAAQYVQAPQVTRERLYIEAMEAVYSNTAKVIINQAGATPLFYVPQGAGGAVSAAPPLPPNTPASGSGMVLPEVKSSHGGGSAGQPSDGRERGNR